MGARLNIEETVEVSCGVVSGGSASVVDGSWVDGSEEEGSWVDASVVTSAFSPHVT